MNILVCPVCSQELILENRIYTCANNHCFDVAKEGYVNLLLSNKSGETTGDNKEMALSRRDFLMKGYYSSLASAVGECMEKYSEEGDTVLDICCGEGYYTDYLAKRYKRKYYGFDLSKNMVRLSGKKKCGAEFFVANIASIPVRNDSVKFAFHLFAPFHSNEFSRVIRNDGVICTAIPGKNHLFGLKSALYDEPYYNDEKEPETQGLTLVEKIRVKSQITLESQQDINALFQMTPYYYHTPTAGMEALEKLNYLTTEVEFILLVYRKGNS